MIRLRPSMCSTEASQATRHPSSVVLASDHCDAGPIAGNNCEECTTFTGSTHRALHYAHLVCRRIRVTCLDVAIDCNFDCENSYCVTQSIAVVNAQPPWSGVPSNVIVVFIAAVPPIANAFATKSYLPEPTSWRVSRRIKFVNRSASTAGKMLSSVLIHIDIHCILTRLQSGACERF